MSESEVPRKYFITGGLGFIGRRLGERLRREGLEVVGVDLRGDAGLGIVAGDITEPGEWQGGLAGCDTLIHTAAVVGMSGAAERFWRVNCVGTRNVLDAAVRCGVKRFVHISSIVVFGFEYPDGVGENFPVKPNGVPYVDTKIASEQIVLQSHAAGEIACVIVRPGDVYGPGSQIWTTMAVREIRGRRLILPAKGRGEVSPVYVDDLVEGIVLAAGHRGASGKVFTMTGGATVETREFFGHYARMLGRRGVRVAPTWVTEFLAGTVGRWVGKGESTVAAVRFLAKRGGYSIERARRELGYEPKVDLAEGMRRCEEWLRREGMLG